MQFSSNNWLTCYQPRPQASYDLICFPYGGAAASVYRTWDKYLPPNAQMWAVQLPGRENRFNDSYSAMAEETLLAIAQDIADLGSRKLVFFGHSMGSLLSVLVASRLTQLGQRPPVTCYVSGHPPYAINDRKWSELSDEALTAHLTELGGIADELLKHNEFFSLYLERIRMDYVLYEALPPAFELQLDSKGFVLASDADPILKGVEMSAWRSNFKRGCAFIPQQGGHFYFSPDPGKLLQSIRSTLPSE